MYTHLIRSLLIVVLLCVVSIAFAQTITHIEYYIDTDPGIGSGTSIPVTAANSVTASATIPVTGLSLGFHRVYVRCQDSLGQWTAPVPKLFFVDTLQPGVPNINGGEYYIDTDPGTGNGTAFAVPTGVTSDTTFAVNLTGLTYGYHRVQVRLRDSYGVWTATSNRYFFIDTLSHPLPNIIRGEYYIDTDPGTGNGSSFPVRGNVTVDTSFVANLTGLTPGFHQLFTRLKDSLGIWTAPVVKLFFIEMVPASVPNLVYAEYFIDSDPGYGSGHSLTFTASDTASAFIITTLPDSMTGYHNLYARFRDANGVWSHTVFFRFDVEVIPGVPQYLLISYNTSNTTATLNWTAASGAVAHYRIYRYTSAYFTPPGTGTLVGTVNSTTLTFTDSNLTGADQYYYRVTATNE